MTTYYVDDTATGANDGTSWTDAYASVYNGSTGLLDLETLVAGDEVRIRDTHDEDFGASTTLTWTASNCRANPIKIISSTTSDVYSRGAALRATGGVYDLIMDGMIGVNVHGLDFESGDDFTAVTAVDQAYYYDCTFTTDRCTISSTDTFSRFEKCTFTSTSAAYPLGTGADCRMELVGCEFTYTGVDSSDKLITGPTSGTEIYLRDCDLSSAPVGSIGGTPAGLYGAVVSLERCKMHANTSGPFVSLSGNAGHNVLGIMHACFSGTDTDPSPWKMTTQRIEGTAEADDTVYRTGGASDGTTDYSWKATPSSNVTYGRPLELPPIAKFVSAGSQTVALYLASTGSLNDDDVWIEVESPSEEATADAQAKWQTTRPDPLATATALTTDSSSTWSGTGVTTKMKIEVTIAPTEDGIVKITPYIGTYNSGTAIFIDPIVG